MRETTKKIFFIIYSFLKYPLNVKGSGVIIRKSYIGSRDVQIREFSYVFGSRLIQNIIVNEEVSIANSVLSGFNRIAGKSRIGNSIIGEYSYVGETSSINNTEIGRFCSLGPNLKVGIGRHPTKFLSTNPLLYSKTNWLGMEVGLDSDFEEFKKTKVGSDVWIGANVFLSEGITVGNGAIIGAGSVVTKDIPDYAIVGGVPAKIIRYRFEPEVVFFLQELKWWDKSMDWIRENKSFFNRELSMEDLFSLSKHLRNN